MADQPTLSAEQMAEVRAAIGRAYGDIAVPWTRGHVDTLSSEDDAEGCDDVATILNAVPALLALADECERLRRLTGSLERMD